MHPKIKSRPTGVPPIDHAAEVQPPLLHDVTNPKASAKAASRQKMIANQPSSGTANHARHHVSRHTQA